MTGAVNIWQNREDLLKLMCDSISELFDKDVKGIGIASPGPLDAKTGIIKNTPNLPFKNFNRKRHIEKKFSVPVKIANDADCVAIAELKLGCKKKNFIIFTIGTGIGGGVIIDGKLYGFLA